MKRVFQLLTEIAPPRFDVELDVRYATSANLTGTALYRQPLCFLHSDAAVRLEHASALARGLGYRLRLFDGYRPTEVQAQLWRALPDPQFIADPRVGSHHSRGVAIDLTLIGTTGAALDMGTEFDDMTAASHHGRTDVSPAAQRHRALLLGVMVGAGWCPYAYEWWHYHLPQAERYPLLADSAAGGRLMPGAA